MHKRAIGFLLLFAVLLTLLAISYFSTIPTQGDYVDWTMYGFLVSPEGTVRTTTTLLISGTISCNTSGRDRLNLNIQFPDEFQYAFMNDGTSDYYSRSRELYGLRYYVCNTFTYDRAANTAVASRFALCDEKGWVIVDWDDDKDIYLVASTDPNADPNEILQYFQVFREIYVLDD